MKPEPVDPQWVQQLTKSVESLEWANSDGPTNYWHYTKTAGRINKCRYPIKLSEYNARYKFVLGSGTALHNE